MAIKWRLNLLTNNSISSADYLDFFALSNTNLSDWHCPTDCALTWPTPLSPTDTLPKVTLF